MIVNSKNVCFCTPVLPERKIHMNLKKIAAPGGAAIAAIG